MEYEEAREKIRKHWGPGLDLSGHDGSKLKELPPELAGLKSLDSLDLSHNGLVTLPDWLPRLTNLQTLNLRHNGLKTLPDGFPQLANLQTLELRNNDLKSLPEGFGQLTKLRTLDLRNNDLKSLPEGFGQLTKLQTLDLNWNSLGTLPGGFFQLTSLQTLNISGNPIDIPVSIFKDGEFGTAIRIQALFTYLRSRRRGPHPKATFQIPKELRTAFKQYITYFNDYLEKTKGLRVGLEVKTIDEGVKLILEDGTEAQIDQINGYFIEYMAFIEENVNNLQVNFEVEASEQERWLAIEELKLEIINLRKRVELISDPNRMLANDPNRVRYLESGRQHSLRLESGQQNHEAVKHKERADRLSEENQRLEKQVDKLLHVVHEAFKNRRNIQIENRASADANAHAEALAKAEARAEAKAVLQANLPDLQDAFADLHQSLPKEDRAQTAALKNDLNKLSTTASKEEIEKSGVLSGIRQFFKKIEDAESGLSKALATGKKGVESAQKLGRAYNSIAQWVGLPQVPAPFLGKND